MSTASLSSQLFVSVKEGSALCGLSEQVIRRLLSDGRIRGHRPSGTRRILVDRQSLLDYVTGGRPTPAA